MVFCVSYEPHSFDRSIPAKLSLEVFLRDLVGESGDKECLVGISANLGVFVGIVVLDALLDGGFVFGLLLIPPSLLALVECLATLVLLVVGTEEGDVLPYACDCSRVPLLRGRITGRQVP